MGADVNVADTVYNLAAVAAVLFAAACWLLRNRRDVP